MNKPKAKLGQRVKLSEAAAATYGFEEGAVSAVPTKIGSHWWLAVSPKGGGTAQLVRDVHATTIGEIPK